MTWVIVGASAGLGRAIAECLARDRQSLLLVSADQRDLASLAADFEIRTGAPVRVLAYDASDHTGLARRVVESLDSSEIVDGLIFPLGALSDNDDGGLDSASVERLVRINFLSVVSVVGALLPRLMDQQRGVVVGFGSVAAVRGRGKNVIYAASKRALESYFESLRHVCQPRGINVLFYVLGYLDTNLSFGKELCLPKADPARIAERIRSDLRRRSGKRHLPAWWLIVASVVRQLPWFLFRRLRF